ncbi:hypothetical protein [Clavibacter zhangzhiyongii]|uniref:hypothetical protein n=1 Tax=Clavibacter zhangzhiyongii TaxID=2768071 RepID=UPI0039E02CE1
MYAATRILTSALMLLAARTQIASPWGPASPSLLQFATFWDTGWYRTILLRGLPVRPPGRRRRPRAAERVGVHARLPGRRARRRGRDRRDLRAGRRRRVPRGGRGRRAGAAPAPVAVPAARRGEAAVVLVCVAPLSPLFQIGYAESLSALVLLVTALLLLVDRRYAVLVPAVVVLAFTRPLGAAFALALVLHIVHRLRTAGADPFPVAERARLVLAATSAATAGACAWPVIAWIRTGSPTAYTDTELAWRAGYVGFRHLIPFEPWFDGAAFWIGGIRPA